MKPYAVTKEFENALSEYTGAPFVVTCRSCTDALLMCLMWEREKHGSRVIDCPRFTYVGVAQSILNAGHKVRFTEEKWNGSYYLKPTKIIDSARLLTSLMYEFGTMTCLSFHPTKHLSISTHGGAILLDDPEAYDWLKRCRFDGRREGVAPKDDDFVRGIHSYMVPITAAEGICRLAVLPEDNKPLPNSDYSDLSKMSIFQ